METVWLYGIPALSELLMLGSATSMAIGWYHIRRRRVALHRRWMLTAAGLGAAFFVVYVTRSLLYGDTTFAGPQALHLPYYVFLALHIVLATAGGVLGIITLRRALGRNFRQHRRIAPTTAWLWFIAAGTGLAVYLLLYVIYAPGPTFRFY